MSQEAESSDSCRPSPVNALFVCQKCGDLCIALSDSWSVSMNLLTSKQAGRYFRRPVDFSSQKKALEYRVGDDLWQHKDIYDRISDAITKSKYPSFPLCNTCAGNILQQIKSQNMFLELTQTLYKRLDISEKRVFQEALVNEIQEIKKDADIFRETASAYKSEAERIENKGSRKRRHSETFVYPECLAANEERPVHDEAGIEPGDSQFMLSVVFHIGYTKHYGTINGMRIGQNASRTVPTDEINTGLSFLAQLLQNLCRISGVDASDLRVGADVSIGGCVLSAADMESRWNHSRFSDAIGRLFGKAALVFDSLSTETQSLAPPFTVDMDAREIGGHSFVLAYRDPTEWSHAMKFLLFDFKFVQARLMRTNYDMYSSGAA